MLSILEFEKRSNEGPVMKSDEFDLALTREVRQLVKKYSLKYNPEQLIVDDTTADAVFNGAVDLLVDIGLYNMDTQRVTKFSREEVNELVSDYRLNPRTITFGKGKDAHTLRPRTRKDTWAPVLWGAAWPAYDEKTFIPFIQAVAQEKVVQGLALAGCVASVGGVTAKRGTPSEVYCSLWEINGQTEALRRAGRPDLLRGLIPMATSLGAMMASFGPGLLEPWNGMVGTHIIPEQKIDWERLNIAMAAEQRGISPWTSAMSTMGGLTGGPAGTAIGAVANLLAQLGYSHGKWGRFYFSDLKGRCIDREELWAYSAAFSAAERHLTLTMGTSCTDGSPMSSYEEGIVGEVMIALTATACGAGLNCGGGSTPLARRIHADVMCGIAGMDGAKVNDMLQKLSLKIDEMGKNGGERKLLFNDRIFTGTYNTETLKPKPEYLDACKRSVDILNECGVPISDRLVLD